VIVLAALGSVVASVVLARGSLGAVSAIRLRSPWMVFVAMVLQIAVINVLEHALPHVVAAWVHVVSYALAAAFLYVNRRISGLWVVACGAALNVAPIVANGGVMPASPAAVARAGRAEPSDKFANSAATAHAELAWLGDVFAVPAGYPLANVFSVGDVVLVLGAGVVLHRASGSRLVGRRRAGEGGPVDNETVLVLSSHREP
jgi:hypothetical protein